MESINAAIETHRVNSRERPAIYATNLMRGVQEEDDVASDSLSDRSSTSTTGPNALSDYSGSESASATEDEISVMYSMEIRPYLSLRQLCEVPLNSPPGSDGGYSSRRSMSEVRSNGSRKSQEVLIDHGENGYECQLPQTKKSPWPLRAKLILFALAFVVALTSVLAVLLARQRPVQSAKTTSNNNPDQTAQSATSSPNLSDSPPGGDLLWPSDGSYSGGLTTLAPSSETTADAMNLSVSPTPLNPPTSAPSVYPTSGTNDAWNYFLRHLAPYTKREILLDASRPQGRAFLQIMMDHADSFESLTSSYVLQSYAAMTLYFSTSPRVWDTHVSTTSATTFKKSQVCWYWGGSNAFGCAEDDYGEPVIHTIILTNAGLSGSLPEEICHLEHLERLDLNSNELTGSIPSCLSNSQTLKTMLLYSNALTGPLPKGILLVETLEELEVSSNALTGDLQVLIEHDDSAGADVTRLYKNGATWKLRRLKVDGNAFTGEVPAFLGALGGLKTLTLHANELTGVIDEMLCDRTLNDLKVLTADCQEVMCECCTVCF